MANGSRNGTYISSVVTVAAGIIAILFQLLWAVVWNSVNGQLTQLQHEIERLVDDDKSEYAKANEIKRLDQMMDNQRNRITRMDATFLTRDSYEGRHIALTEEVHRQTARIDEIQRAVGSAYSLGDKIKELQDQIRSIQDKAYTLRPAVVSPNISSSPSSGPDGRP